MIPQKTYSVDEAQKKLEFFCSYQERCHKEVVAKLESMRMIPDAIDVIVVYLIENNFLNEMRFAKSFVRGKFRIKKWGKQRIIRELKFRDISQYNIHAALSEIDAIHYLETLDTIAQKKLATITETNSLKRKKKLADFLRYRGWESQLVYAKVNELID